ncbi:MAG: hypothetical protein ACRD7E_25655 [Bryobacteraceae bacterium]
MPASKSLKTSPISEAAASRKSPKIGTPPGARFFEFIGVFLILATAGAVSAAWFYSQGHLLYYGDAEAHLNIARRVIDSRTPGYDQIGTVWLPLPHALMLPFIGNDFLWRSGLAGTIPGVVCFVAAGLMLFAAARQVFASFAAAICTVLLFALNPNLLYLQSVPMTESVFFAALLGLLFCTVRFQATVRFQGEDSMWTVFGAALFSNAASMTRYEGWSLIPFVALYFLITAREKKLRVALTFSALAALGPLYWLAHNWWYYGNFFEFYNGPYSARAIYQRALDAGMARYPGDQDWAKAWLYFSSAAGLCVGPVLVSIGLAGAAACIAGRIFWPVLLLALPSAFYVLSMHNSTIPIFVPHLWPNSYYNTRYGLAVLPLFAFAAGALVVWTPRRFRPLAAAAAVIAVTVSWVVHPHPSAWICWKESDVNSIARRDWTAQAAEFFRANYRPGDGILTSFGDMTGIYREAGIPMRETLHEGNSPMWDAAVARPDLFLREEWAVAISADRVSTAMLGGGNPPGYSRVKIVATKGGPVIEIYRKESGRLPPAP